MTLTLAAWMTNWLRNCYGYKAGIRKTSTDYANDDYWGLLAEMTDADGA